MALTRIQPSAVDTTLNYRANTFTANYITFGDGTTQTTAGGGGGGGPVYANNVVRTINFLIDNGGSVITTGVKGITQVDFIGTVNSWTLLGDVSGTLTVDVSKASYANYNTFTASGGGSANLVSALKNSANVNWTGFSTVAPGDILQFAVSGTPATITRALVAIKVTGS